MAKPNSALFDLKLDMKWSARYGVVSRYSRTDATQIERLSNEKNVAMEEGAPWLEDRRNGRRNGYMMIQRTARFSDDYSVGYKPSLMSRIPYSSLQQGFPLSVPSTDLPWPKQHSQDEKPAQSRLIKVKLIATK